jgi:SNF2 family DNA or RNA helicase
MIDVAEDAILWEREDVRMMAKIIGSEHAVFSHKYDRGHAPLLHSILRLARRKGMILSKNAERELDSAELLRKETAERVQWEDHWIADEEAKKYFKHQRADLARMIECPLPGYLCAHEAGVGKTLLAIRWAEWNKARRRMIVCPNTAKEQWADEIQRWGSTGEIVILEGSVKNQIAQMESVDDGWIIGHWESLAHARDGWLARPWDFICLDEVQNIQNRQAQRTETVFHLKGEWRMALSAHPYANGVDELFPILRFLYPKQYPSFWRWAHLHIQIDEGAFGGLDLRTPRRPNLLQWEIAPFLIRRLWKDTWKNLPPITRVARMVDLTARGQAEYKRLRKQFFVSLDVHAGEKNILAIPSVLARVTRMRQYLIDPGIFGAKEKSVKYPAVYDLIKELEGRPPVIFTMYRETALRLQKYLEERKLTVGLVVGGMRRKTNRVKKRFLRGEYDAVIIMITVGGTSLNFGKYGTVIYLDHPWTQKDVEQTEGRVRRPEEGTGKVVPTTSYHVMVRDSYEQNMLQLRRDKHKDFEKVFTVATAHELFDEED